MRGAAGTTRFGHTARRATRAMFTMSTMLAVAAAAGCRDEATAPTRQPTAAGAPRQSVSATATTVSVALSATASEAHTYFTYPNQVTVQRLAASRTLSLTSGVPTSIILGQTREGPFGAHPLYPTDNCAVGFGQTHSFSFAITANGVTGTYTQPIRVRWICNGQAQTDALPSGPLTLDLGGGVMLEISQPATQSWQFTGCTDASQQCAGGGSAGTSFRLLLTAPAVAVDEVPPTIAGSVAPAAPDGANGWYVSAPTVSWTCADAESGVASCSPSTTLGESATAQQVTGLASDVAGNTATAVVGALRVDLTNPIVACAAPPTFFTGAAGTVSATVADAISGAAQAVVSASVSTATAGQHVASLTGSDNAGRTTTVQCAYTVHRFDGFFRPVREGSVNTLNAGQTLPLKWRLTDASGSPITGHSTATVTARTAACALGTSPDLAREAAAGSSGLQDLGDGYYQFNWATPKSYAKSCKTVSLDLGAGVVHSIAVEFRK